MPQTRTQRRRYSRNPKPPAARRTVSSPSVNRLDWPALANVYSIPGLAILPLRLFLGITFIYAGIQKLSDPGFLRPGAGTYIGAQILGFSRGSPIRFLLLHLAEHAQIIGALTVLTEIGIGALVLVGLFTRLASIGGFMLNFGFFLSASWHTYPYFMGADIVWDICWLTLALTGPGAFCLDAVAWNAVRSRLGTAWEWLLVGPLPEGRSHLGGVNEEELVPISRPAQEQVPTFSRREALAGGLIAAVLVVLGLVPRSLPTAGLGQIAGGATRSSASNSSAPGGHKVGTTSQIPANSAIATTDPMSGDPAVVVHTSGSNFYAYDAVCTHAGCTVQYDPQYKLLVCPCHGGAFDPAHGAAVVGGPPPAPLTGLPIKIDSHGNIYLT